MSSTRRAGFLFGLIAYVWWGLIPLYFRELLHVRPLEIMAHRLLWAFVMLAVFGLLAGLLRPLVRAARSPRVLGTLFVSSLFLSVNWYLYVYAVVEGRVVEAGLGYYMMPLANAFLATVFLGEKLRPAHWVGLSLIVAGVSVPLLSQGDFTWIAIVLPLTFGVYSLVRKVSSVDSFTGLTIETFLLGIPSLIYVLWLAKDGRGSFGQDRATDWLLIFGGVMTIVPLFAYVLSIRRLPLLAVNLIQFISPTLQLMLGYFAFREAVTWQRWTAIVCVWVAVAIFITDAVRQARRTRLPVVLDPVTPPGRLATSGSSPA